MADGEQPTPSRSLGARLAALVRDQINAISPERTRRPTLVERLTVQRLSWTNIVRLNRWLEVVGKLATAMYVVFIVTVVLGVDWKSSVESTFNGGNTVQGVLALAIVLPTLIFVALHSITGYGRWRLQRELWRRDVASMTEGLGEVAQEARDVAAKDERAPAGLD